MASYTDTYNKWFTSEFVDEATKEEMQLLSEEKKEEYFYKQLEFGTAGLRGIIAPGPNCMNVYTVRKATQGLCEDIKNSGGDAKTRGVAISYDSRHFSAEFAKESACVLAANGIKAYLFDALRPTPELSFAVRYLGCARGIMITASHNPKEYNGYKVYGEDGGQLPPESADYVASIMNKIDDFTDVHTMDYDKACKDGIIEIIGENVDEQYYLNVISESINSEAVRSLGDEFKVIYSPFHGTGNVPVREILKRIGCKNVRVVKEQELPDPDFSTVKSPNPEEKEGFAIAMKMAEEDSADIIFATDPDGDRLGVVVRDSDGEFVCLTGNQIGVLLSEFILRNKKEKGILPHNGAIIKTIVTTDMIKPIAADYGVKVYDVLTGFKFIGEKIKEFEEGTLDNEYVFGFEESYGYLAGTYCRDKDAVVAAMLVTEMAADYKTKGMTLYDGLVSLYEKYGFYLEDLCNFAFKGVDGSDKMKAIMEGYRSNPPKKIAGLKVRKLWDVLAGTITDLSDLSVEKISLPKSNVLKFELENDSWIAVRPSGTEPKIKYYFAVKTDNINSSKEKISVMINEMKKIM